MSRCLSRHQIVFVHFQCFWFSLFQQWSGLVNSSCPMGCHYRIMIQWAYIRTLCEVSNMSSSRARRQHGSEYIVWVHTRIIMSVQSVQSNDRRLRRGVVWIIGGFEVHTVVSQVSACLHVNAHPPILMILPFTFICVIHTNGLSVSVPTPDIWPVKSKRPRVLSRETTVCACKPTWLVVASSTWGWHPTA